MTASATASATHSAIDAVWRIESARLIAGLARIVRDVGLAEELAQDALVAALERWPESGVPDNPGAWLMATAKHRAIDLLRRSKRLERKHEELGREIEARQERAVADLDAAIDDPVGDDLLRLVFISCHPVLSTEARVALTLRLLGGLTTEEIARAFLVAEPTVAQIATKVLTLNSTVPTDCTAVASQSIRPGWNTKTLRRAVPGRRSAASTASRYCRKPAEVKNSDPMKNVTASGRGDKPTVTMAQLKALAKIVLSRM